MKSFLRKYRRVFYLLFLIIGAIIYYWLQYTYKNTICTAEVVKILNKDKVGFLTEEKVKTLVRNINGQNVVGSRFADFKISELEKKLNEIPYIKNAEVYRAEKSKLFIEIEQREPVARFIFKNGQEFYVDNQGVIIPVDESFLPAYVIIVSGELNPILNLPKNKKIITFADSNFEKTLLRKIFLLIRKIQNDKLLQGLIQQIYVNKKKEIILVPQTGDFKIYFGNFSDFDRKFLKLKEIFRTIVIKKGWNEYQAFDLSFKNQIVAIKK